MSGFLRRWAERKAETRQSPAADTPQAEPLEELRDAAETGARQAERAESGGSGAAPSRPPLAQDLGPAVTEPDAEELAARLAALPALDEIGAHTDVRPFLQDFVPAALRKAALRKAWAADPIISTHLDVARDYAWEFNAGPLPVGFGEGLSAAELQRSLDHLGPLGAPETTAEADAGDNAQAEAETDGLVATEDSADANQPRLEGEPSTEAAPQTGAPDSPLAVAGPKPDPEPPASQTLSSETKPRLTFKRRHGSALPG